MSDTVKCPYCEHDNNDLHEFGMGDGDSWACECDNCESKFTLTCTIRVSYTAKPIEGEMEKTMLKDLDP